MLPLFVPMFPSEQI